MVFELESQIRKWRAHLQSTGSVGAPDLEELESHLRDSIDDLCGKGLAEEEAFLVSIRRLGDAELLGHEFAKISTEQVWRQLLVPAVDEENRRQQQREVGIVVALALLAGVLSKVPALFGYVPSSHDGSLVYAKNLALIVLPSVALYLVWLRSLSWRWLIGATGMFAIPLLLVNLYPSVFPHHTSVLTAVHLPIALWLSCGLLYAGPGWRRTSARLDFVRYSGEIFIYSVLIALGGAVLIIVTTTMFRLIDINIYAAIQDWIILICGAAIPIVAAFLVERKKSLIESIAPVLARIFSPLFLAAITSLLVAITVTGTTPAQDRNMLIWFDLLLALVLGLVLYTMSARDAEQPPSGWDVVTLALVLVSIAANGVALAAIVTRLSTFGVSPNKVAALGENIALLVNLVLLAIGYGRFVLGKLRYQSIVALQMRYLPAYLAWAAVVVIVFPPVFGWQ
jgi:hypothetical protein